MPKKKGGGQNSQNCPIFYSFDLVDKAGKIKPKLFMHVTKKKRYPEVVGLDGCVFLMC